MWKERLRTLEEKVSTLVKKFEVTEKELKKLNEAIENKGKEKTEGDRREMSWRGVDSRRGSVCSRSV